ncbi:MAG: histidine kinase N-terminal 7TM domain-containing protein [Halobacteriota archaeon]
MNEQVLSVFLLVATMASVALAFWLATVGFRRGSAPASREYGLFMLAVGTWCGFDLLAWTSPVWNVGLMKLTYLSGLVTIPAWFLFISTYVGEDRLFPRWARVAVGLSLGVYLVIAFSPFEGTVFSQVAVVSYGFITVPEVELGSIGQLYRTTSYLIVVASYLLLGRFFFQIRNVYRKQTGAIFVASLFPLIGSLVHVDPKFTLGPVFTAAFGIGAGVAMYRYRLLEITPLAADTLIDVMQDPVFVFAARASPTVREHETADETPFETCPELLDSNTAARTLVGGLSERSGVERSVVLDRICSAVTDTVDRFTIDWTDEPHHTYDVTRTPIHDQHGIRRGDVVVLRDVTMLVERERELQRETERLDDFTSVVSHDLRNPLNVITGRVELARETGDTKHLDAVQTAAGRMNRLIADLLTLARDGDSEDETTLVSLTSVAEAAWDLVESPDAALEVDAELLVEANPTRLQQLLENLFRNAVDHGGDDVTVRLGELSGHTDSTDGESGDARGFFVEDDGHGIPPAMREDVFERGVTTAGTGMGLGLAIVEQIANTHGWSITLSESAAGGTRFEFWFSRD